MIFEVPQCLVQYVLSFQDNGVIIYRELPESLKEQADELSKKWKRLCKKESTTAFTNVVNKSAK